MVEFARHYISGELKREYRGNLNIYLGLSKKINGSITNSIGTRMTKENECLGVPENFVVIARYDGANIVLLERLEQSRKQFPATPQGIQELVSEAAKVFLTNPSSTTHFQSDNSTFNKSME